MNTNMIIAALLLSLMPLTVGAQGTDINSRDLRGKVVRFLTNGARPSPTMKDWKIQSNNLLED